MGNIKNNMGNVPNWKKLNVPKLRFPGFEGDWEMKKLGEVIDFKVTNSLSRDNLNYEIGTVKNIHYGDIIQSFKLYLILLMKWFHILMRK